MPRDPEPDYRRQSVRGHFIGGFDLALEREGIAVTAAAEIDKDCRGRVLAPHFPETKLFTDVQEITGDDILKTGFEPETGILTAGWPCQGNSVAGVRRGMADPRSGLWLEVVRLLSETRPRWFIGENVPGLLTVNRGADFYQVVKSLDELGYGYAWRVLDAQYFGVPQRRKRVILVGCLGDGAGPAEVLFEPESCVGDLAESPQPGTRVAGTLAASAGSGGYGGIGQSNNSITGRIVEVGYSRNFDHEWRDGAVSTLRANEGGTAGQVVVSTLQGGGRRGYRIDAEGAAGGHVIPVAVRGREGGSQIEAGEPGDPAHTVRTPSGGSSYPMVAHTLTSGVATKPGVNPPGRRNEDDYNLVAQPVHEVIGTLDAHDGPHGHGGANVQSAFAGHYLPVADPAYALSAHHGHDDRENNYVAPPFPADGFNGSAGEPDGPMYALSTQAVHNRSLVGRRLGVRRLTPRECERLQGFPDDWTAGQSDSARYRQLGNAVAVPVAQWVTRRIAQYDSTSNRKGNG